MKKSGKIEEQIASLYWQHICSAKKPSFSLRVFTEYLYRLVYFQFFNFFYKSFFVDLRKILDKCLVKRLIVSILGWCLHFRIAFKVGWLESLWWSARTWCSLISRIFTMFEKASFKVFATLSSLEIILSFSVPWSNFYRKK